MGNELGTTKGTAIPVELAAGPQLDAFGKLRVSTPTTIFQNKNLHSRNRNQWEEIITGAIMVYSGLAVSTFGVGNEVRGLLPTGAIAIGTVVSDNGTDTMVFDCDHNDFQVGDTITDQTSGATATVVSANTGSDIQHLPLESAVELKCGIGATDSAIRQAHRYIPYVPGKSQNPVVTFVFGAAKANVVKRAGLYDNYNGAFFEQTETDIAFVLRSNTSGSVVDTRYVQTSWSEDSLDGTGDSATTLDASKFQILGMDFQWLGGGDYRWTFDIAQAIEAHIQHHANEVDTVYMATPSLPIRYEISNTGVTASPTTMKEVCSTVSSEGGYLPPGLEFSTPIKWRLGGADYAERAITVRQPIIAIRLKNQYSSEVTKNRKLVKLRDAGFFARTNDTLFEIVHIHEPIDLAGDSWTDVGGGSAVEYSIDLTAVTGRPAHVVDIAFTNAGGSAKGSPTQLDQESINEHAFLAQNFDSTESQMFVIYATARTGTADVTAHMTWIEME